MRYENWIQIVGSLTNDWNDLIDLRHLRIFINLKEDSNCLLFSIDSEGIVVMNGNQGVHDWRIGLDSNQLPPVWNQIIDQLGDRSVCSARSNVVTVDFKRKRRMYR